MLFHRNSEQMIRDLRAHPTFQNGRCIEHKKFGYIEKRHIYESYLFPPPGLIYTNDTRHDSKTQELNFTFPPVSHKRVFKQHVAEVKKVLRKIRHEGIDSVIN